MKTEKEKAERSIAPSSFFLYGATRSGKTHALASMKTLGRMCIADVEGQVAAEIPDAHTVTIPAPLPRDASSADVAARLEKRNAILAEAAHADVVLWPCLTTADYHACLAAIQSNRMGAFATLGVDSLTYLGARLISEICGVSIVHRKRDGSEEEAVDPVFAALPDFSGQQVRRSMEMRDWQRFGQKMAEMVTGALFVTKRCGMHLVVTALEEKRDIYEGEGQAKRFVRIAQGPLLQGRVSSIDIPPLFMYYLRTCVKTEDGNITYAAQTQTANGWPCGVRGKASKLFKPFEIDPDLAELLYRLVNL